MSTEIKEFYNLETWQVAHQLALEVYKVTQEFPQEERFGIVSQLRRAAGSVTANIAEGFGRYHFKDKMRFYFHARGSVAEIQSFLMLARDLGFLDETDCDTLIEQAHGVRRLINGLIRSVEKHT
jgi:four helix bundle protein